MSEPNRLFLEPFDKSLIRPSRMLLAEKLERLVEETQQEGDSGEPASTCSVSSNEDTQSRPKELRHSQNALDVRQPSEASQEHAHQERDVDRSVQPRFSAAVMATSSRFDFEHMLEAEEVRRQLYEELSSEKITVKLLEKENAELRREIQRCEREGQSFQEEVRRRQSLLDQVLIQGKQKCDLVPELKELLRCSCGARDADLRELRYKVNELGELKFQLEQVKGELAQIPKQRDVEVVEWLRQLEAQLVRTEDAVKNLSTRTAQNQGRAEWYLQLELQKSDMERMRLENENRKLSEDKSLISQAAERKTRMPRERKSLENEVDVVKTQLRDSRRELRSLKATNSNPKEILLECENRALKVELEYLRGKDPRSTRLSCHGYPEDERCTSESETFVFGGGEDSDQASLSTWVYSESELELEDAGSSVCCDFTSESEQYSSESGSSEVLSHSGNSNGKRLARRKASLRP